MRNLVLEHRPATPQEQEQLAAWSGWGAVPHVFESGRPEWEQLSAQLKDALTPQEHAAASASTRNGHYTDPRIAQAMWHTLAKAGFRTGLVFEPGCGSGTFIGQAPKTATMVGVELDPVTARIASALYPDAHIRLEPLERTLLDEPRPCVAAIGNVPFDSHRPYDPLGNPHHLSLHNYALVKAMTQVRPGGYGLLLTSSFTLDAKDSKHRRELLKHARLLGAVRLPNGAFERVAGTSVVADLLVLRARDADDPPTPQELEDLQTTPLPGGSQLRISNHWLSHPDRVLGTMTQRIGSFGAPTLQVDGPTGDELAQQVAKALTKIIEEAAHAHLGYSPTPTQRPKWATPGLLRPQPEADVKDGRIEYHPEEGFRTYVEASRKWHPVKVPASRAAETRVLCELRDAAVQVIESQSAAVSQSAAASQSTRESARARLNQVYDRYAATYGPVNRFTLSKPKAPAQQAQEKAFTLALDQWRASLPAEFATTPDGPAQPDPELAARWRTEAAEGGEPVQLRPHLAVLRSDPDLALVEALEVFDPETQTATKAPIFTTDVLTARPTPTRADTPAEALALSMAETGQVDLARIGGLLGTPDAQTTRDALGDLVYTNPKTGALESAWTYLSGDVRQKLTQARLAAQQDPTFTGHVTALEAVCPPEIALEDIALRPGVRYVSPADYQTFVRETFKLPAQIEENPVDGTWRIQGPRKDVPAAVQFTYGTAERDPLTLFEAAMNNRVVTVSTKDEYDVLRSDPQATARARAKVETITKAFTTWAKATPERAARIAKAYNEAFNTWVRPDFTPLGQALTLPGKAEQWRPHPYQQTAVAQALNTQGILLDHVVGAGKTGTIVMTVMEMRRLGRAIKPWVVVPNQLVDQWATEWRSWYPAATILTIPTGLDPKGRREYAARAATGDWDAVICPSSVFSRISIDQARAAGWLADQSAELRAKAARIKAESNGSDMRIKAIEAAINRLEVAHDKAMAAKDQGITFEQTGCDLLVIDEAHNYKNLARASGVPELACPGSDRARDLDFKLRSLREARQEVGDLGGSLVVLATGTPMSNSPAERWVMLHYLRPDLADKNRTQTIDQWAQVFTGIGDKLELGPDGTTWRMVTRVKQFTNTAELRALEAQYTSTVTTQDLTRALPAIKQGGRQVIARPASPHVRAYVADLARRAQNLDPEHPELDNLLKITNDGRLVALDGRLRGLPVDDDGGRVRALALQVARIHQEHTSVTYVGSDGQPSPTLGGFQLVFCDRSTPKPDEWNFYQALRDELTTMGLEASKVRFVHDAETDAQRAVLFADARAGRISVIIGSTEKLGTGVNVQDRLVALHHADCPWRASDLEQREGRILRQGNQNPEVEIHTYVTEGTYDAVLWQIVTRKAANTAAMRKANAVTRTLDLDVDEMTISAAAAQAIATGDPRVIRRAELIEDITRLETLRDGQATARATLRLRAGYLAGRVETSGDDLKFLEQIRQAAQATNGDTFAFTPTKGPVITHRGRAGQALQQAAKAVRKAGHRQAVSLGTLAGSAIVLYPAANALDDWTFSIEGGLLLTVKVTSSQWDQLDPVGFVRRLENALARVGEVAEQTKADLEKSRSELDEARAELAKPGFEDGQELDRLQVELADIDRALQLAAEGKSEVPTGPQRVDGEKLRGVIPYFRSVTEAHIGDIVQLDGDQAGQFVEVVEHGPAGTAVVRPEEPGRPMTFRWREASLVSRLASQLTQLENLALQDENQRVGTLSEFGKWIGQTASVQLADQSLATGTIQLDGKGPALLLCCDDRNIALEYKSLSGDTGAMGVIHNPPRDELDGGIEARLLIPGDKVLTSARPDDLPPGSIQAADRGWMTPDGTYLSSRKAPEVLVTFEHATTPLSREHGQLLYGPGWRRKTRLADLRPGDLAPVESIDPKSSLTGLVRIYQTPGSYGTGVIGYQLVDDPSLTVRRVRRRVATQTPITRHYASLTSREVLLAANPGAQPVTKDTASSIAKGCWVIKDDSSAYHPLPPEAGQVVEVVTGAVRMCGPSVSLHVRLADGTQDRWDLPDYGEPAVWTTPGEEQPQLPSGWKDLDPAWATPEVPEDAADPTEGAVQPSYPPTPTGLLDAGIASGRVTVINVPPPGMGLAARPGTGGLGL